MNAPVNDNPGGSLAGSSCFLCDTPGFPFVVASCRGADVTICTPLCLQRHGIKLPLTEAALTRALIGEVV